MSSNTAGVISAGQSLLTRNNLREVKKNMLEELLSGTHVIARSCAVIYSPKLSVVQYGPQCAHAGM